jgi:serine/threonine protein kinase
MNPQQELGRAEHCPSRDALRKFSVGDVSSRLQESLALHIAECASCEQILESLEDINDDDLARMLGPEDEDAWVAEDVFRPVTGVVESACEVTPAIAGASSRRTPASGRFRVLKKYKEGGHGVIFVAEDTELRREVALKKIQDRYADDPATRSRFIREAEITGALEHPGIVPVYSLRSSADGRPFYAMRLVSGKSLKEAIVTLHEGDGRGDPAEWTGELRKLLKRFIDACYAVEYAHSQGVLHRDLKPSNVLLGPFGETLVADWGLAKRIAERTGSSETRDEAPTSQSIDGTDCTPAGLRIGTVSYMSPEQAEMRMDDLGPASDVYSLGATLYCILTGRPPFPIASDEQHLAAVIQLIRKGKFLRPRAIRRAIPRALEAVCLKALALEVDRRYSSARALRDDVERWLADLPVQAETEPWSEHARRWVYRHWTLVVAMTATVMAAAVLCSLGSWMILNGHKREEHHRTLAFVAAARADEQTKNAHRLTSFVVELFQTTDPLGLENRGFRTEVERINARETVRIIENGAKRLLDETDPSKTVDVSIRATLLDAIGNGYRSVGDMTKARPLIEQSLELRLKWLWADVSQLARSYFHLALLEHFSGNHDVAEVSYRKAIEILGSRPDADPLEIAKYKFHLGWLLGQGKNFQPAAALFDEVAKTRSERLGVNATETRLARLARLIVLIDPTDRRTLLVETAKFLSTGDPLSKGLGLYFQADLARKTADRTPRLPADVAKARQQLGEVLDFARANLPARHPLLGILLGDIAEFERNQGNPDRALTLIGEALDIGRESVPTHPYFIDALATCGMRLVEINRFEEAEAMYLEALERITATKRPRRDESKVRKVLGQLLDLPRFRADSSLKAKLREKFR